MKILAVDQATECASTALWCDGELAGYEAPAARDHGGVLLAMAESLLAAAGLSLRALDAIAFGRGPGAFTGLRLAASVTQGLAFATGLPVIPVSDLRALAQQVLGTIPAPARALACQDARMGEVYWAAYRCVEGHAHAETEEDVAAPAAMIAAAQRWLGEAGAAGAGSGFAAYTELAALGARLAPLHPDMRPRAREIALLAAHEGLAAGVAPELALPVYLRNDVAAVPPANMSAT